MELDQPTAQSPDKEFSINQGTVVLAVPQNDQKSPSLTNPFLSTLMAYLGESLSRAGYNLLISPFSPGKHDWNKQLILSGRAKGIIVFGQTEFCESINLMAERNAPCITWGAPAPGTCTVGSDNEVGGYIATKRLLEVGRRRIVFLGDNSQPEMHDRFCGYQRALQEEGIDLDEQLVVPAYSHIESIIHSINNELVEKSVDFDGIFATSDVIAIGSITVISRLGLSVPRDISIVGFDDTPSAAYCNPPLTSVAQDIHFGAEILVKKLCSQINGEQAESIVIPTRLVIRSSCMPKKDIGGMITMNEDGKIEHFDKHAEKIFGYTRDEVKGKNFSVLMPQAKAVVPNVGIDLLNRHKETFLGFGREIIAKHKSGAIMPIEMALSFSKKQGKKRFTCILWDTNEGQTHEPDMANQQMLLERAVVKRTEHLMQLAERMERLALEDVLTGLSNRRLFDRTLEYETAKASRSGDCLSLIMLDVDYFKAYNDNYGHVAGDECLKAVASALRDAFPRRTDTIARIGGEEFAVILPDTQTPEARMLAERALVAVAGLQLRHEFSDIANHITISAGVYTCCPDKVTQTPDILSLADQALYVAKENGRNRVEEGVHPATSQP
jgi:diguanylate cyclase (GGDEF)-like protein/PAS domain S-box-containing protein